MTRVWSAERHGATVIRLLCNGVHLASIIEKHDCGGDGWQVNPMSPNHPRSRKYHATAAVAVRSYGKDAVAAVEQVEA